MHLWRIFGCNKSGNTWKVAKSPPKERSL